MGVFRMSAVTNQNINSNYSSKNGRTRRLISIPNPTDNTISVLRNAIFPDLNLKKLPEKKISDVVRDAQDVIADISANLRGVFEKDNAFNASPSISSMGLTSTFGLLWNGMGILQARMRLKQAYNNSDLRELIKGTLDLFRSILGGLGSLFATLERGTRIALLIDQIQNKLKQASVLIPLLKTSDSAMTAFFGILYGVSVASHAIAIHEKRKIITDFSDHQKSIEQLAEEGEIFAWLSFLEKKLTGTWKNSALTGALVSAFEYKLENKYLELYKDKDMALEKVASDFVKEALYEGEAEFRNWAQKVSAQSGTSDHIRSVIKKLFTPAELIEKGREIANAKWQTRKEKRLIRVLGESELKAIKQAMRKEPLSQQIISKDPKIRADAVAKGREIVKDIAQSKNLIPSILLLSCAVVGIIATFIFPLFGVPISVVGIILLLTSLINLCVDIRSYLHDLSDAKLKALDGRMLLISTLVCLLSIATALFVTIFYAFPPGTLLLLIISAVWLGVNGYTYYRLLKNRRESVIANPNLQVFSEMLKSGKDPEVIRTTFKKLSVDERVMLSHALWKVRTKVNGGELNAHDKVLDRNFRFGEEFLDLYPLHDNVQLAAKKALNKKAKIEQQEKEKERLQMENVRSAIVSLSNTEKMTCFPQQNSLWATS